jgi:hypothetical protein
MTKRWTQWITVTAGGGVLAMGCGSSTASATKDAPVAQADSMLAMCGPAQTGPTESIFGAAKGLDHHEVLLDDAANATPAGDTLVALGFKMSGWKTYPGYTNDVGWMPDGSYVELATEDAGDPDAYQQIGLEVADMDHAVALLRAAGVPMDDPSTYSSFRLTAMTNEPYEMPTFLIQYATLHGPNSGIMNDNTARRLSSVWVAVNSVCAALPLYEKFGLPRMRCPIDVPELGAIGCEVAAGPGGGTILLVQPATTGDPQPGTAAWTLHEHGGKAAIMGTSIEVNDLSQITTRAGAQGNRFTPFLTSYSGIHGTAIHLPSTATGTRDLEFFKP